MNDIQKVVDFYHGILGLEIDYRDDDKFVQSKFENGVGLGVKKAVEDREKPGHQTVFISVDNIEEYYKKYKDMEFEFFEEFEVYEWGKFFAFLDPDGNKVGYIERK